MPNITRILCPTDFSEAAAEAVVYAEQMAREANAELLLLHVFDVPLSYSIKGQEHPRDARIELQLNEILSDSPHGDKIIRLQQAGDAGEVICWMAQDRMCDLIILGTHGRTGLAHLLFGSVAEYVLRHARCPVLTIRDRDPNEPMLTRPNVAPIMAPRFM